MNQPCEPSHGNDQPRSTAEISAITIVGKRTRKPQKIAACIAPGSSRWNSLRWPSTITASLRTRRGTSSYRSTGFPARTRRTSSRARRVKSAPATASAAASASAPASVVMSSRLPELGGDRGNDLVQVADHRVVGVGEDRRLGIVVDREQLLRALAPRDVLGRAADPARDVEVGRHLRSGLPHLVGVRTPARARDDARTADGAVEQPRELLEDREPFGRADAAAAGDDDLRVGERDLAARVGHDALDDVHRVRHVGAQGLHRRRRAGRKRKGRGREELPLGVNSRFLEQRAAPANRASPRRRAPR